MQIAAGSLQQAGWGPAPCTRRGCQQQARGCHQHDTGLFRPCGSSSRRQLYRRSRRGPPPASGLFGGDAAGKPITTRQWLVPDRLVSCDPGQAEDASSGEPGERTVYTIRLQTSWDRGAALDDPLAGVNVALLGEDGRALLHRISPVHDPSHAHAVMAGICSIVGDDAGVGADCSILSSTDQRTSWPAGKEPCAKLRFQEGSVDEVSFLAPELGALAAILVAPEGGSWVCDEVDVFSSRRKHMDRFVCRRRLGGRKGEAAAYLTPVPPDAVVYGTGDAARVITKEQAAALQAMSLVDYGDLKARLLLTTALLTLGGSGVAALASGVDAALPFALGGCAGLAYQALLQVGADAAVASASAASAVTSSTAAAVSAFSAAAARSSGKAPPPAPLGTATAPFVADGPPAGAPSLRARLAQALGSAAVRLALLMSAALLAVWAVQQDAPGAKEGGEVLTLLLAPVDAWQLGVGLCGFMTYKLALLAVSLAPGKPGAAAAAEAQSVTADKRA